MKLCKILAVLFIFSCAAFGKSGLELGIFVPLGFNIGIHYYDKKPSNLNNNQSAQYNEYVTNNTRTSHIGFEAGALFQAGYRLELNKEISFSFMGELGYSRDTFNYRLKDSNIDSQALKLQNYRYYSFDSIVIGVLPKINYKRFSFGIGAGMKIFLSGTINDSHYNQTLGYTTESIKMIDTKNYKDYFSSNIIPYLKLTLDYSIYTSNKFDIVLSAYFDYDFALKYKIKGEKYKNIDTPIENISSVDLGIQIGAKIRPMN
ncbi:hypothetical protein JQ824_07070 [Brachyspira hyodysenteriae]|uniref:hypothetical protein n=1 Tax=Brachyspira hyodysenteriae TaxID=159 RepID=UPI00063DA663|nr:hypothetical protein [Brachyspira hyodysenteriae]AUJ50629.1 hypothetical protein BH718_02199 [Brachyspira hyodysenteriae]KLI15937.1 hypothetical protein SU45_08600 [Brachyspira hyodysenteriae]KLI16876.1 hypothetical protein SU44_05825 [Brachyspira hyodysenteriae]KLI20714.1 hypothetical protein SU46_03140 [Brachyspira hyodysenteriae]KLI26224.1 hypothetical protein SU43_01295 [Brachyspira hyodysenteriae]